MKSKLIIINWCLSFCSLCIDTERSPFWAVVAIGAWFTLSTILMNYGNKKGLFNKIIKQYKLDEL